ncbi:MAG: hypothetical protein DRN04_07665 [Thermoprotei archaeon]|nr:MAG: hypothetical protein DRN04_07665 [Thermoprotei archaeon]
MRKYSTISIPVEVKRVLEKDKGKESWGEYLMKLYNDSRIYRKKKAFQELVKLLDEEDLRNIEIESKKFRENFKLRT